MHESGIYPPGAEFDRRAPWRNPTTEIDEDTGEERCANPSRHCRCTECYDAMSDEGDDERHGHDE